MSKMPAFAFPSDMKNWVERHMAQALADAHSQGIVDGLEMAAKFLDDAAEKSFSNEAASELDYCAKDIRAQIEKEKQGI